MFRHFETKSDLRKSWYFPLLLFHKLFRYQKFSETQHRRVPVRNVSVLWDKKFSRKCRDITLWSIIFFDTRNYWKTKVFPYGHIRHCETKIFLAEIFDTPSFLSISFFATRSFVKHSTQGFLYEMFRYWETKNFRRKIKTYPSEA